MQLRLVQGSSRQRVSEEQVAMLVRMPSAPARMTWVALPPKPEQAQLPEHRLSTFVAVRRTQLEVLARSRVTAGLRTAVARETWLASVRRRTYPRLATEPLAPPRGRRPDRMADEGGIYSW